MQRRFLKFWNRVAQKMKIRQMLQKLLDREDQPSWDQFLWPRGNENQRQFVEMVVSEWMKKDWVDFVREIDGCEDIGRIGASRTRQVGFTRWKRERVASGARTRAKQKPRKRKKKKPRFSDEGNSEDCCVMQQEMNTCVDSCKKLAIPISSYPQYEERFGDLLCKYNERRPLSHKYRTRLMGVVQEHLVEAINMPRHQETVESSSTSGLELLNESEFVPDNRAESVEPRATTREAAWRGAFGETMDVDEGDASSEEDEDVDMPDTTSPAQSRRRKRRLAETGSCDTPPRKRRRLRQKGSR